MILGRDKEFYNDIFFWFFITGIAFFINHSVNIIIKDGDKRLLKISLISGFIISSAAFAGALIESSLSYNGAGRVVADFNFKQYASNFHYIIGLGLLFAAFVMWLFNRVNHIGLNSAGAENTFFSSYFKIWLIILICWLPYFIITFPGIYPMDPCVQLTDYYKFKIRTHHPVLHTLILGFLANLITPAKAPQAALGVYTASQVLVLSAAFAYMIRGINKIFKPNTLIMILFLAFCALYPLNPVYSVTATKDTYFSAACILLMTHAASFINKKEIGGIKDTALLIFFMVLAALFRNNMIYCCALYAMFLLFFFKGCRMRIIGVSAAAFITFFIINSSLIAITDARKGDFREALSIPIMQIARVYNYKLDNLTDYEKDGVKKLFSKEITGEYNAKFADTVKNSFKTGELKAHAAEYAKLYIDMGIKYPGVYFDTFLIHTNPLWYPFMNALYRGYKLRDSGIAHLSKTIPYFKDMDMNKYRVQPLHKLIADHINYGNNIHDSVFYILTNQSLFFWFLLLTLAYLIYIKGYKEACIIVAPLCYIITIMFGPLMYMRYFYPIAAVTPIVITLAVQASAVHSKGE